MVIAAADIGSVSRGKFAWWASTGDTDDAPSTLAAMVAKALNEGEAVALGFECPLFVPLAANEKELTCARPGEGNRPWSAGAGSCALTTGIAQVTWILRAIRQSLVHERVAYLDWEAFEQARQGLFLWEAFVSGKAKAQDHVGDARLAGEAFLASLPDPRQANAVLCESEVQSLVGAALLRTGWAGTAALLGQPCIVVRAGENAV